MVLISAVEADLSARQVFDCLANRGVDVRWWVPEAPDGGLLGAYEPAPSARKSFLRVSGERVDLEELTGVMLRRNLLAPARPDLSAEDADYAGCEWLAAYFGLFRRLDCPVLNRPTPGISWTSLLSRYRCLDALRANGLRLPRTLVTSNPEDAMAFFTGCGRRVVLSNPEQFSARWEVEGGAGLEAIRSRIQRHPVCLQETVAGEGVILFLVGGRVIGARRGAEHPGALLHAAEVKPAVYDACRSFAASCGLELARLELVLTPGEEAVCLGFNDQPSWLDCEPEVQEAIAAAVADRLSGREV